MFNMLRNYYFEFGSCFLLEHGIIIIINNNFIIIIIKGIIERRITKGPQVH